MGVWQGHVTPVRYRYYLPVILLAQSQKFISVYDANRRIEDTTVQTIKNLCLLGVVALFMNSCSSAPNGSLILGLEGSPAWYATAPQYMVDEYEAKKKLKQ